MSRQFLAWVMLGSLCVAGCWDGRSSQVLAGLETPSVGNSKIAAASFLKEVDRFGRKVVFFAREVDLPCLKVPEPDEDAESFFDYVGTISLPGSRRFYARVVMSKDRELLFASDTTIFRVTKEGLTEKLVRLSELTLEGHDKQREGLIVSGLLCASTSGDIVYIALSNEPVETDPGPYPADKYTTFVGKLDYAEKRLQLIQVYTEYNIAVDPDAGMIYKPGKAVIEREDFEGKARKQWQLSDCVAETCRLAPDRRSLLVSFGRQFFLLDLRTGDETRLPILGRAAAWGSDGVVYFIQEAMRDGDIVDTSLFRFRVGDKEPSRLFVVSCKRHRRKDSVPGVAPELSADHSWLVWPLPVEYPESGTILLDLTNQEYRILSGRWAGVQWP